MGVYSASPENCKTDGVVLLSLGIPVAPSREKATGKNGSLYGHLVPVDRLLEGNRDGEEP